MTQLNPAQQAAVDYNGDAMNLLVVAGAGCGKTRTIISRAARLIQQGVNPASILLITFTNRAAKEIRQRIRQEVGDLARELQISTFHGYCFSVMTRLPKSFEIKGLTILDADDQQSLVSLIIGQRNFDKEFKKSLPKPARLINIYFPHEVREGIRSIFDLYESEKKRRGYLDFDDLLEVYADILDKKPKLKHDLARQFSEVLVDELQDTNPLQVRTLRHFADEGVRLFCVGDPAQSIYGFRGASFEFIQRFNQQFDNTHKFLLADNYRSDQNILNLSNWLLDGSDVGYELRLKSALDIDEEKPNLIEFNNEFDEAEWIASQIRQEEENGTRLKDQMVLIRSAYDGRQLEAELISRKIPYMFIGGTSLIKAAHVKDFFSLLRAVRSAEDELAWVRYLTLFPR
jgi:DNA helicase-2/ATP-dependent DNA helicase PcrA